MVFSVYLKARDCLIILLSPEVDSKTMPTRLLHCTVVSCSHYSPTRGFDNSQLPTFEIA